MLWVAELFLIFCFFGDVTFSEYYISLLFPFCMESTLYVFLPDCVFLPCNHGLNFLHQLVYVIIQ